MGTVYGGYDLLLSRVVAIKILAGIDLGTEGRARLLNEAQAAARLNHPNIVTVYDAGETDHTPFIVMELAPGKNLRQYAPQNLEIIEDIIRQTCAALEHAHSAGIIHRDIKPENIILTPSGVIKLMDFGLAFSDQVSRLTATGEISGTLLYLAPELWHGQLPNPKTDLYALGVMFYELVCGQAPYQAATVPALIDQISHAVPVPPSKYNPSVSPAVEALILRLLEKQPANRPASAMEVRIALDPGQIHPESGSSFGKFSADQKPCPRLPAF